MSLPGVRRRDRNHRPRADRWSAAAAGDDALQVSAQNAGDVHARMHAFSIAPAAGDGAPLTQPVATYILPGQSHSWRLEQEQTGTWRRVPTGAVCG